MDLNEAAETKRARARERQRKRRAKLSDEEKTTIRCKDKLRKKERLQDPVQRDLHLKRVQEYDLKRLQDPVLRDLHLKRVQEYDLKRLQDPVQRDLHLQRVQAYDLKRLQDPVQRDLHVQRVQECNLKRLQDPVQRDLHLKRVQAYDLKRLQDPHQRNLHNQRVHQYDQKKFQDPAKRALHYKRLQNYALNRFRDPVKYALHKCRVRNSQKIRLLGSEQNRMHIRKVISARTNRRINARSRKEFLLSKIPAVIITVASLVNASNRKKIRQLCMKKCDLLWAEYIGMLPTVERYILCARKLMVVSRRHALKYTKERLRIIQTTVIQEFLTNKLPNASMCHINSRFNDLGELTNRNFHIYDAVILHAQGIQRKLLSSISLGVSASLISNINARDVIRIGGLHVHRKDIDINNNLSANRSYHAADEVYGNAANQARTDLHGTPLLSIQSTESEQLECTLSDKYALGDENCPAFPATWPSSIRAKIEKICNTPVSLLAGVLCELSICTRCAQSRCYPEIIDLCTDLPHALRTLSICFTHIRTIKRTLEELTEYVTWTQNFRRFREVPDFTSMSSMCHDLAPRLIKLKHPSVDVYDDAHHFESNVIARFGSQIEAFLREEWNIAIYDCFSCRRMFKKNEVSQFGTGEQGVINLFTQSELLAKTEILLCKECRSSIKKNEMPILCYKNGLQFDDVPQELSDLNFVELACIRIIRPFMNLIRLSPLTNGGPGQGHFGYEGTVLLLPSSPTDTISHVLERFNTLPSPENLRINVVGGQCGSWKSICRFDKVLNAVQWLKNNNHIYSHIQLTAKDCFDQVMTDFEPRKQNPVVRQEIVDNPISTGCHVLTQITPVALTSRDPFYSSGSSVERYKNFEAVRNTGRVMDVLQKDIELLIFPHIFVKGHFGLNHNRQKKVSDTKYIRLLLTHRDRRFSDKELQFFFHDRKDKKHVNGCMFFQSTKKIGQRELRDLIQNGENVDDSVSSMFSHLKTHESYWKRIRSDLATMIRYFGAPTWFVTLNPSEREWKPLQDLYRARHPHIDMSNTTNMTIMDTVLFCRYFNDRIRNCFSNLLIGEHGVLGNGIHYWFRIEYQSRGAPHVHCIIWIKGAPQLYDKRFSEADVIKYIDEKITTRIPDPVYEPEAHRLVQSFMKHRCTATCTMQKKKNMRALTTCRFGFPQPISSSTKLVSSEEKIKNPKLRSYVLRRVAESQRINAYNVPLLLAWRGNIDVQYLGESSSSIIQYVTAYVGKAESKNTVSAEDFGNQLHGCSLQEYASMALRSRQLGLPEVTDHLLGHPAHRSSAAVMFVNTDAEDCRTRILKPFQSLEGTEDSESSTLPNMVDVYYPSRPAELETCSLYNFAYNMRLAKKRNTLRTDEEQDTTFLIGNDSKDAVSSWLDENGFDITSHDSPLFRRRSGAMYILENGNGYAIVKSKPILIKYFIPSAVDEHEEAVEDNFRRYLLLFKPFRNESSLKGDCDTFRSAFEGFLANCSPGAKESINKLISLDKKMATHFVSRREQREIVKDLVEAEEDVADIPHHSDYNDTSDIAQISSTLNDEQLDAFEMVLDNLNKQDRTEPFKNAIIAGVAGCGKSHLITAVTRAVQFRYQNSENPTVIIAAPTGLAAMNVQGGTIHSVFHIEVEKRKTPGFRALDGKKLEQIRTRFKDVRVVVMDECSMMSNVLLWKVSMRCQEISGEFGRPFGGYMILLFGDLLQLPPVRLAPVFEVLSTTHARSIFGTTTFGYNIWRENFDYRELIKNMRQQGDQRFAQLLQRFRLGTLISDDIVLIEDRRIEKLLGKDPPYSGATVDDVVLYYQKISIDDPKTLCIFGKTACVNKTNIAIMEHRQSVNPHLPIETIKAYESADMSAVKSGSKVWLRRGYRLIDVLKNRNGDQFDAVNDAHETPEQTKSRGGLPKHLKLQLGCRVMLLRNTDAKNKLVNGVLGEMKDFVRDDKGHVIQLRIKFDHLDEDVFIQRQKTVYELNPKLQTIRVRQQFPICVAYAVTIHKCQGQTLDNVIVDLSSSFSCGQMYVAASRTRTLDGLHVMHFTPTAVKVSRSGILEYNRQRSLLNMELLPMPNPTKAVKCDWDRRYLGLDDNKKRQQQRPRTATKQHKNNHVQATVAPLRIVNVPGDDVAHLPLPNLSGADCCFNAIIQSLRVLNCIDRVSTNNVVWRNIMRLTQTRVRTDIGSLREDLAFDARQQCVSEILQKSLQQLNAIDTPLFMFVRTTEGRCTNCPNRRTFSDNEVIMRLPDWTLNAANTIEELLTNQISISQNDDCNQCGGATFEERVSLDLSTNEVLVLQLPQFSAQGRRHVIKLNNQNDSTVTFMGNTWKVMAGIVHTGRTMLLGHYKAIVNRGNNRWMTLNDDNAPKFHIKFPSNYNGVYLIFLEKEH